MERVEQAAHMDTGASATQQRERFIAQLEQHRGIVLKVAGTYAWSASDREELAQEITAQLWMAFGRYDAARPFATWMYRVALNVAISQTRRSSLRSRHHVPFDDALHDVPGALDTGDEPDARSRALRGFIGRLDPLNRALLLLYLDDRSHREIAEVLGISETNVATKLGRLKQRIRNQIA